MTKNYEATSANAAAETGADLPNGPLELLHLAMTMPGPTLPSQSRRAIMIFLNQTNIIFWFTLLILRVDKSPWPEVFTNVAVLGGDFFLVPGT